MTIKISELTDGMGHIDLEAMVSKKGETRTVNTRFGIEMNVADMKIRDDSGEITLSLWNENINKVEIGSKIKIGNGYTNSFRGETKLNVGRYGTIEIIEIFDESKEISKKNRDQIQPLQEENEAEQQKSKREIFEVELKKRNNARMAVMKEDITKSVTIARAKIIQEEEEYRDRVSIKKALSRDEEKEILIEKLEKLLYVRKHPMATTRQAINWKFLRRKSTPALKKMLKNYRPKKILEDAKREYKENIQLGMDPNFEMFWFITLKLEEERIILCEPWVELGIPKVLKKGGKIWDEFLGRDYDKNNFNKMEKSTKTKYEKLFMMWHREKKRRTKRSKLIETAKEFKIDYESKNNKKLNDEINERRSKIARELSVKKEDEAASIEKAERIKHEKYENEMVWDKTKERRVKRKDLLNETDEGIEPGSEEKKKIKKWRQLSVRADELGIDPDDKSETLINAMLELGTEGSFREIDNESIEEQITKILAKDAGINTKNKSMKGIQNELEAKLLLTEGTPRGEERYRYW